MLYQIHEMQRAVLNPMSAFAAAGAKMFSSPYSPLSYLPFANRMAAGYELFFRLGKDYEKPEFGLHSTTVDGTEVPVLQRVDVLKPFCRLLHFQRFFPNELAARPNDPIVLLVAPLSGHHSTLLRDTVRQLITAHDVYVTDWTDGRMVPASEGPFHLDDYIAYIQEFIRHLGPDVHVISVCQPTVPVLAAISLMASANEPVLPKTMTMMGGPIDTSKNPTAVNNLATTKPLSWFENNVIYRVPSNYPGYLRSVYPGFLQHAGFVAMNPDRHMNSHHDFYLQLVRGDDDDAEAHRAFYDEYNAVLDMPAEYYLDTIKTVFQDRALANGTWVVRGDKVKPEDIKSVALFTIEGELDDISGSGQTEAAQQLCSGIPKKNKQHFTAPKCGHYGIFSGKRWRQVIYPRVHDFIRAHA
jgi:poly(3-hydroxybutyrate) depolymerase